MKLDDFTKFVATISNGGSGQVLQMKHGSLSWNNLSYITAYAKAASLEPLSVLGR